MDGILGKTFSRIDYKVKYEIVYGFMPRPDYIDELNEIFTALKTNICYEPSLTVFRIKKSECPAFFQQNNNKQFIINGLKIEYRRTGINGHLSGNFNQTYAEEFKRRGSTYGNGEETEDAVIFYKFVYLTIIDIRKKSLPEYKYSTEGFYEENPDRLESETVYLLLRNCFDLVRNVKTCKLCKQLYREEGRKPSKPITKITLKEMVWELVKDDPVKWIEKYTEDVTEKTTYTWRDDTIYLL